MRYILFSPLMVKTLLNTKPGVWPAEPLDPSRPYKWMTRRLIKPQPENSLELSVEAGKLWDIRRGGLRGWYKKELGKPFCNAGDVFWVQERWRCEGSGDACPETVLVKYRGKTSRRVNFDNTARWKKCVRDGDVWKTPTSMPREAVRLFLQVKNVRVERVQEITEEDSKAEGVTPNIYPWPKDEYTPVYRNPFIGVWDDIYEKRGYDWKINPWVWVIEFMRLDPEKMV
jgi:hypothetical protein